MGANREVMQVVRDFIRGNPDAARALAAMQRRGLPKEAAQEEIARAFLGCLWEAERGLPDRLTAVLKAIEDGKSAALLFPDELYT
jgi:hypothetical protein